jgi:segregation and condensation protein A
MGYEVKLDIFEGPLDLLLYLIRKNEVDIFDIPIALITDQYLAYLDLMKALNVSLAGDFLVMASTLLYIKSKMLLPRHEEDEEGDPRDEITRPLLEYLKLKEAAGELSLREMLDRDVFARHLPPDDRKQMEGEEALLKVNLFQLIDAFKKIVEQNLGTGQLEFQVQKWSLKERMTFIMDYLKERGRIFFHELFKEDRTLPEFVASFLALLELVQMGMLQIFQTGPDKEIMITALFEKDEDKKNE